MLHEKEVAWSVGLGLGGQRLFIVSSLDLVVLVHCGLYTSPIQGGVPLSVLNRFVLPAVRDPWPAIRRAPDSIGKCRFR